MRAQRRKRNLILHSKEILSFAFMYKKGRVNSNSRIISTDEDPSLRIESSAIINLRGVSTKLNKYIVFTMQTYKKLNTDMYFIILIM